jgi:hypothetical protein
MSTEPTTPTTATPAAPQAQPRPPAQDFNLDHSAVTTSYANFARVTGTPEELVLDFGLNTQMAPNPSEPIKVSHRLVLNYYTAKRLLGALGMAVQQHESIYGVLETDVQKRVRFNPAAGRPGAPRPTGQSS